MTAVNSPGDIAAWLEQLETPAFGAPAACEKKTIGGITEEILRFSRTEQYKEISHLLEGSPYPQPFASMSGDAGKCAASSSWYCLALLLWIRGVLHLQGGRSADSCADLRAAGAIFYSLIGKCRELLLEGDDFDDTDRPERANRLEEIALYGERLEDIHVDMACNAEEVYAWLHAIRGGEEVLRPHIRQMWQIIAVKIREGEWQTVDKYLEELVDFSNEGPDYLEKPEVLALCGRALHQIHMHPLASSYLRRAVAEFHPHSHKQAVARWLLGTVQWWVEWEQRAAIENLERSIEDFQQLQIMARRKEQKFTLDGCELEAWYSERLKAMRRVLADRICKHYP